ncbi:MAG: hypothetical protein R3E79_23840 [Caldilineaceae bacterium]
MNAFGPSGLFWSKRHRQRNREIAEILTRHGLGALVAQIEPLIETDIKILISLARLVQQRNPLGEL